MAYVGAYRNKQGRIRPRTAPVRYRGHKTKMPSAGIKHKGSLMSLGYREDEGEDARHRALGRSVNKHGYAKTTEKVNALAVVNKGDSAKHARLESDLKWLRSEYRDSKPPKMQTEKYLSKRDWPRRTGAIVEYQGTNYRLEWRAQDDNWFAVEYPNRMHVREIPDSQLHGAVEYYTE